MSSVHGTFRGSGFCSIFFFLDFFVEASTRPYNTVARVSRFAKADAEACSLTQQWLIIRG